SLIIDQREIHLGLSRFYTRKSLSVLEQHHHRSKARRDRATRFQNRFRDVDPREATAHAREFRAGALALLTDAMTLEAQRFFSVEKDLAAAVGAPRASQGRLNEAF